MKIRTQFIGHKNKWSAYTTINGLDIQEYGDTPEQARGHLINRIAASNFLLEGIKINGIK